MTQEELVAFLKQHLKVHVRIEPQHKSGFWGWVSNARVIRVTLVLGDQILSTSTESLPIDG